MANMAKSAAHVVLFVFLAGIVLPVLPGCQSGEDPVLNKRDSRNDKITKKQDDAASGE